MPLKSSEIRARLLEKEVAVLKAKNKSLEQHVERLADGISRHTSAKKHRKLIDVPKALKRQTGDKVRMICGDSHGSSIDPTAAGQFLCDVARVQPDEIVMLGDHVNCGGFLAEHHVMGYVAETEYSYAEDIAFANSFLDSLQKAAPKAKIWYLEGNHECLSPDHDVLTSTGWIPIADVDENCLVASLGKNGQTVFSKPLKTHKYEYSGPMIRLKARQSSAFMTPNHRLCYYGQYRDDIRYERADKILQTKSSFRVLPTSGTNRLPDLPDVSDDRLRLLGWLMTDGCVSQRIAIYQSKEERIVQIRELLDRLGVKYTERVRQPIQGVPVKSSKAAHEFCFLAESYGLVQKVMDLPNWHHSVKVKKTLPEYVSRLSTRQFNVLYETIVDGDGSRVGGAHAIYGTHPFLSDLQAVCVINGMRANLCERKRKGEHAYWVLSVCPARSRVKIESKSFTEEPYSGFVYCLTTPHDNFIMRHDGRVTVTGNSRVEKWVVTETLRHSKDAEFLRKALAPEFLLHLADRGIDYIRRDRCYGGLTVQGAVRLGKCYFYHGVICPKHAEAANAAKVGGNIVSGHTHRRGAAFLSLMAVGEVGSWNPGCLCQKQPMWRHGDPTGWTQGELIQLIRPDETFLTINIPIIDGVSLLTPLMAQIG